MAKQVRQDGERHPTKPWVWSSSANGGKGDWRSAPKAGGSDGSSSSSPGKPSADSIARAKAAGGKTIQDPKKLAEWATKAAEDSLVKVVNNTNGNALMRNLAYKELENRKYDVSTLDTSGTLDKLRQHLSAGSPTSNTGLAAAPGANVVVNGVEDGGGEITERWYLNRNDPRVRNRFNLNTKDGRIKYDLFVDEMKRKEPDYRPPAKVIQALNTQYLEFLNNDAQRFMISAGGAGIGKTYGFNKLAEILNKKPFNPETDQPGDGDYDIFEANDVGSKKQLLNILKAHNGKIIVFDDTDAVLTRHDTASIMKKATASTGTRIVGDPDDIKQNFEFTGRVIIMTNKDIATLSQNEDTKAIISRAMLVSEIYMTIPETLEILEQRYQHMEFDGAPRLDNAADDKKERDELLQVIKDNVGNIDPGAFTTRTFQEILINKRAIDRANEQRSNPLIADLIGSDKEEWKEQAVATLTKAAIDEGEDYMEKADGSDEDAAEVLKAEQDLFGDELEKAEFSTTERKKLAKTGAAEKDGSYPIRNRADLKNAIQAYGRSDNKEATKKHIIKRANELGAESDLPDHWKEKGEGIDLEKAEDMLLEGFGEEFNKADEEQSGWRYMNELAGAESILGIS